MILFFISLFFHLFSGTISMSLSLSGDNIDFTGIISILSPYSYSESESE